jgi:LPXTG-site transpeptidase (sortase) family protein
MGNLYKGGKEMKFPSRLLYAVWVFVFVLGLAVVPDKNAGAAGTISLTAMGVAYTQNFDTLANTGTSNNIDALNNGWYLTETGGGARDNERYAADNGGSSTGDTYSYGTDGSTERALGGLRTGTTIPTFGACFTNNTGSTIAGLEIAYTGEEWRLGAAGRVDQINLEYSTNATSLTTGTWTGISALNFLTPDTITAGAKNGNTTTRSLSATLSGLSIPNASTFWIRWTDVDAASYDDGLAVDNFSLRPFGSTHLSINDVTAREGHSGTTIFTFTVNLSSPAPAGGVTFDIATADDSATSGDGDYAIRQLIGQTIPAGSSTYTFDVLVNSDLLAEPDEIFAVNVTNMTGANPMDGQGLGTINNDDTSLTVASGSSPAGFNVPVDFTATVIEPGTGTPTGTVEFFDGAIRLGTATLNASGQATLTTASLTTGSHTITAAYSGDANFGGSTSPGWIQVIEGPPSVLQITDGSGRAILENERTRAAPTQLLVIFSKDMQHTDPADPGDVRHPLSYILIRDGSTTIPIDSVSYDPTTFTATLNINAIYVPLSNGRYALTVSRAIEDTLGVSLDTDFVRVFYVDQSAPQHTNIVTVPNNVTLINGATLNVRFSSINITFNEDLNNAGSGAAIDDVTNSLNYLLLQTGPNGVYDTADCQAFAAHGNTPLGDDIRIPTGTVTYANNGGGGPFVATVLLNGDTVLPNGTYRLLICGTTSIVDLAGNRLNNGADSQINFNVLVLDSIKSNPQTGFAPGVVTVLPKQPADTAYTDLGSLWIEIPALQLKTSIAGVPLKEAGWDVTWLNQQVGWLEGTAYPTWEGNTVLTAHGYTADGNTGPFALLQYLKYGDTIIIHQGGMKYTYAVRTNLLVRPNDTRLLTKHEALDWITLITCQQYDDKTKTYRYRRVVRAVLLRVEEE